MTRKLLQKRLKTIVLLTKWDWSKSVMKYGIKSASESVSAHCRPAGAIYFNQSINQSINRRIVRTNPDFVVGFRYNIVSLIFRSALSPNKQALYLAKISLPYGYKFSRRRHRCNLYGSVWNQIRGTVFDDFIVRSIDWLSKMSTSACTVFKQMMRRLLDWSCFSSIKLSSRTMSSQKETRENVIPQVQRVAKVSMPSER